MANVTVKDVGPCKKQLSITIPQAEVKAKIEEQYTQLRSTADVAGFRKGHVPRRLLEKRYNEDVLEDVKQRLLADAAQKAVEEQGLKPIGDPSFDNVNFDVEKDCVFEITLEVEPEFELPEYKGVKLARPAVKVSADEIQKGIDNLLLRRAQLQLLPADAVVAANDVIICDWRLDSEGETVADQKDSELTVTGKRSGGLELDKDLAEALGGAKAGETRELKTKFLDSYPVEKWRGKEGLLQVTPKEIRRPQPPELTDDFAKTLDFDSIADLRKAVEQSLMQAKEREVGMAVEQKMFDDLLAKAPFELPQGVLKAQARNILLRQQYRLRQRGVPDEELEKHLEELRNASEEAAARQLKIYFVLDRIADKEKIFVTENEVEGRIAAMAGQHRMTPPRMRAHIEQEGSLAELRSGMREDKVVDFLLKSAEITEEK